MKRLPALSLLCLALSTLPVSGASAAVMDSSVAEVAGLSMSERHVAIKAEAEAAIINTDAAQCTEATSAANLPSPLPSPLPVLAELPRVALEHHRHAVPMATPAAFATSAAYIPLPVERPAPHC
ncbi:MULTISPECIES: hypothetical protein [Cupriavidus]|uniref:Uncharacterized protein n=1 Tax=Cupriavidus campinensis TaxID=151783 RepID=A0AAE9L5Q5_9BURK|nr:MULTISPECIES: hypothetical protein [Cupriavidus]TSP13578.1 hypothetical protein FGG12_08055 [Cupriavidus campinensis]URF07946.1 hypothetical protein M5D45_22580 [Cupriavidus campinensis]